MSAPLKGRKIIVTRDEEGAKLFSKKIAQYGGKPMEVPLLTISCDRNEENESIFQEIDMYDWIFFTSANGVECFFHLAKIYDLSMESLNSKRIAVVGHKTEQKLKQYGFSAGFIPSTYNADTMAEEFLSYYSQPGTILLVRGNLSRTLLPEELSKAKIPYQCMHVYKTMVNKDNKRLLNEVLQQDHDFVTFTSPSAVDAFVSFAGNAIDKPCVCIGTTTEKRAKEQGFNQLLTPKTDFTIDAMIHCMIDYVKLKE